MGELLLNEIIGVIFNMIIFMLIPFVWWLFFHRKKTGFLKFVGLTKPRLHKSAWLIFVFAAIYFVFYTLDITDLVVNTLLDEQQVAELSQSMGSEANVYHGVGFLAFLPALIANLIGNGLCEELLFRGFILKRLKTRISIWPAVLIQAALFGLMHNGLYLLAGLSLPAAFHIGAFLSTFIAGLLCGILNEKVFDGDSIMPSVLLHGLNNFVATMVSAFIMV